MLTVLEVVRRTTEFLAAKGVESPRLNAELIIGHALGRQRMQLYLEFERPLAEAELERIRPLVRRRSQREPLQYVIGEAEFGGLRLKVDRRALIPRPETELLVELVREWCGANPPATRLVDLGTGTGAIALALAHALPEARVTAVERSAEARSLAEENIRGTGLGERVSVLESDWFSALPAGPYDVIVANPPYLSSEETATAAPEVRDFEPVSALTAAREGLEDLDAIVAGSPRFLRRGGLLAMETGPGQHEYLMGRLREAGFSLSESRRDLTGRDRFILAVW